MGNELMLLPPPESVTNAIWIRQYELAQYPVGMKKQHKITAPERDQIAWWLACGITIREMARRLGRSPCKDTQLPDTLRSFYSYTKGARIGSEFRTLYVSKRTLFEIQFCIAA
jgi:hypothetical protein